MATVSTNTIMNSEQVNVSLSTGLVSSMEGVNLGTSSAGTLNIFGLELTGLAIKGFGQAMGCLGSLLSINDTIWSWVNGNPKRKEIRSLINKINNAMNSIIEFRLKTNMDEFRIVKFKNVNSGKYLDVANGAFELNNKIIQGSKNDTKAQKFYIEYLNEREGKWEVRIHCFGKEKYSVGSENGNVCVIPKDCASGKHILIQDKDGSVYIERDGKVFDVQFCSRSNGANVLFYKKNNQANQRWHIIDV